MPLDPALVSSAQARVRQLREQIEASLHELVADLLAEAASERDAAVTEARSSAEREGEAALARLEAESQATAAERQSDLACMERLLDAVCDLDAAVTLSQVLDKLTDQAASHVARVFVFVARAGELRGWRATGFSEIADPSALTLPLDGTSLISYAATSGQPTTTRDIAGQTPFEALAFATLAENRVGLALPLRVGDRTVAVVYADEGSEGEPSVPSAWPEALEILARHASCRLELLTAARAYGLHAQPGAASRSEAPSPALAPPPGGRPPSRATDTPVELSSQAAAWDQGSSGQLSEEDASALRYARLLISEIKLYHEEAVNEGRRDANLLERLGPEIARARRLYEERIPAEVRGRADHFGQELVRTLANGDPRLLGQAT